MCPLALGRWVASAQGIFGTGSASHKRRADQGSDGPVEIGKRIAELERENDS